MQLQDNYYTFLVLKAQQGSKNSFLEMVELFKNDVYKRALQLTCNTKHAADITCEVFFKAWSHINLLNEFTPFELWLKGITVNFALMYFREVEIKSRFVDKDLLDKLILSSEEEKNFIDLEGKTRELIILHDLEGYSIESYAEILNEKDIADLNKRLNEGRKSLTDQKTIDVLNTISDEEWSRFIADFDNWDLSDKKEDEFTNRLILIKNYRDLLENLFAADIPSEFCLDKLKNRLIEEGEESVKQKEKESLERLKNIKNIVPLGKKKTNYIDNIVKIFTKPDAKEELRKSLKERKKQRIKTRNYSVAGFALLVIAFFLIFFKSSTFPWLIDLGSHNYFINNNSEAQQINLGDIVKTDVNGLVNIAVNDGQIKVFENTAILTLEDYEQLPHFTLQYGAAEVTSGKDLDFIVETAEYRINCSNGKYKVKISPRGIGWVKVLSGELQFYKDKKNISIWQNYTFKFNTLVPYRYNLSESVILQLSEFSKTVKLDNNLLAVLSYLGEKDALTLWYLLKFADDSAKDRIFDKLENYFPLPQNITKSGIMDNNIYMMDEWLKSIKWQIW